MGFVFGTAVAAGLIVVEGEINEVILFLSYWYFLLPIINAFLDWISWIVTRWLLQSASGMEEGWKGLARLIGHIFLDFLAAMFCLALLVMLFSNSLPILDIDVYEFIDYDTFNIIDDDFKFAVAFMLLSTLIPTYVV